MIILIILLLFTPLAADNMNFEAAQKATEEGFQELHDNKPANAVETFRKAIIFESSYAKAHLGLGLAYFALKDYKEATRRLKTALIFDDTLIEAWDYLGQSYEMTGDKEKAFETYIRALDIDPLFSKHEARFNQTVPIKPTGIERRAEQIKALQGEKNLSGKRIYVENDTPNGDTLLLSRFLEALQAEGALVFFEAGLKLQPLFAKGMPSIQTVNWTGEEPDYDYKIALSALPLYFNATLKTIPYADGYLFLAPPQKTKKVGLAWRFDGEDPQSKTGVSLDYLLSLVPPNKGIYLLQEAPRTMPSNLTPLGFRGQSLDDIRGMISQMDEIIAVDGSIARLSAAMGKKVTLILPTPCQWVWFLEGNTTPWFKNVSLQRLPP